MVSDEEEGEEKEMGKGQMWSVDVIIAIVIFISIITVFYTTLSGSGEDVRQMLESNADTMINQFTNDPELRIISSDNVLNATKLDELANNTNYTELKESLGVQGDFCIYVEDSQGRIIPIGDQTSIGKGDINVSGKPCGSAA